MSQGKGYYHQLLGGQRRGGLGTLAQARRELWRAIRAMALTLDKAMAEEDTDAIIRCSHAISQMTASFGKLIESHELELRLADVQAIIDGKKVRGK
jgi:hypothetical protein